MHVPIYTYQHTSPRQSSYIGKRIKQIYHCGSRFTNFAIEVGQVSSDARELPKTHMLIVTIGVSGPPYTTSIRALDSHTTSLKTCPLSLENMYI